MRSSLRKGSSLFFIVCLVATILLPFFTLLPEPVEASASWIGIDGSYLHSKCGDKSGYRLSDALDGTTMWAHNVNHQHWFILDLGDIYKVEKVRSRSNYQADPLGVYIYVSMNTTTWGDPVGEDIDTFRNTVTWVEEDTTDKIGRYVKVVATETEVSLNYLGWGDDFQIFDVYVDDPPPQMPPSIEEYSPTNDSAAFLHQTLSVTTNDPYIDEMNITWMSNSSGTWKPFATNNSVSSGTYTQVATNFSIPDTTYWWSVNISDEDGWTNQTYHLTTLELSNEWIGINSSHLHHTSSTTNGCLSAALDGVDPGYWFTWAEPPNKYFILDLGSSYFFIEKVRGRSNKGGDGRGFVEDINIYISDNTSDWGTAVATGLEFEDSNEWIYYNITPKQGRYIKVDCTNVNGINWGYYDREVFYPIFDVNGDYPAVNAPPVLENPSPTNDSTAVQRQPTLSINASDDENDNMTIHWYTNASGSWEEIGTNTSVSDGQYTCSNTSLFNQFNTTYYWQVRAEDHATADFDEKWTNETYHFTTELNNFPDVTNPSPADEATDVDPGPTLSIDVNDSDAHQMNITFYNADTWDSLVSRYNENNGTYSYSWLSASSYSTTYTWSVNVTDGYDWTNETYSFTTRANNPPQVLSPSPANNSENVNATTTLQVTVSDPDDHEMDIYFRTNASGDWATVSSFGGFDGIYATEQTFLPATRIWWSANVTDGYNWTNTTYTFVTDVLVDFNYSINGTTVHFHENCTTFYDIDSYSWDFGDGHYCSGRYEEHQNPLHTYHMNWELIDESYLNYTVTLNIENIDSGWSRSISKVVSFENTRSMSATEDQMELDFSLVVIAIGLLILLVLLSIVINMLRGLNSK